MNLVPQAANAAPYNGNPVGYADYCQLIDGATVLHGWAHDPQAAAGALPRVSISVAGAPGKLVPTATAGYRDNAINGILKARGIAASSIYGWTASFTGNYQGDAPRVTGTIIDVGAGSDAPLTINTTGYIDGVVTKPYFSNGRIPDACLPLRPQAAAPHDSPPVGPFITAVPTIVIDPASAGDLLPWLRQQVVPTIRAWYPVVGDELAAPDYVPPTTVTVIADESSSGSLGTDGSTIVIGAAWARANMSDLGAVMHEMTHVIQAYRSGSGPSWITEGTADHTREYVYHDREPFPPLPTDSYTMGYSQGSYFLEYIQRNYDARFIHDLNVALHGSAYSDNFFVQRTGKTVDALWSEMMGKIGTAPGPVAHGDKCLDYAGTDAQLWTCNSAGTPAWNQFKDILAGTASLRTDGDKSCLDVVFGATTAGTSVQLWSCNNSPAQQWTHRANGSLFNPHSGKCLEALDGGTVNGTQLIIDDCRDSAAQRWTFSVVA